MPSMKYERIAALYDIYVQTDLDLDFFQNETKEISGEVLELMSGTGRVSIPLFEAGVHLTCVDNCPEMLNIFQQKMKHQTIKIVVHEMDVCELSLNKSFDLIFIPFHSFAEILSLSEQQKALKAIHQHLTETGRFICTLHNPPIRLKSVNGQLKLLGKYPLHNKEGTLLLWSLENYNPSQQIVEGFQLYEEYDKHGKMCSKTLVELKFYLHKPETFELLIKNMGFKVTSLYGDYSKAPFQKNNSPFMIWVLQKE